MKNLTPEQLSLHISHGEWVAMKNINGYWRVFMYERPNGNFQGTTFQESIEECLEVGLTWCKYSPQEITEEFTEYKIIKRPPLLMKAGDKCQIIDSPELRALAKKENWSNKSKEMIGQKGLEIRSYYTSGYTIYKKDKSDYFIFPHWAVALDFSEEEETLSGKEVIVTVDGKEYTAVVK